MATARIEGDLDIDATPSRIARILRRAADDCGPEGGVAAMVLHALANTVQQGHRIGADGGRITVTMHPEEGRALREDGDLSDTMRVMLKQARDAGITGRLVEVQLSLVLSGEEG